MTEELKAFRILLVPLFLIIVFFVITPRMCARKTVAAADAQTQPAAAATATKGGLHIDSPPSGPVESASSKYPEGLDAARIQYLVEIDTTFSEPKIAKLPKTYDLMDNVTQALLTLHYIEKNPDNTIAITRDGAMNLNLTDQGAYWTFPIAKRAFDKVTYVSRVEDDRYNATIAWHYEANPVGVALRVDGNKSHSATAQFVGGPGSWVLGSWIAAPDENH
jgi:hypothetical protein